MLTLIDRDRNLSKDQKERQRNSLSEVLRFCINKTDCRRTQVLSFFGERFDSSECRGGCDVCLGRDENRFTVEDVSVDACKVGILSPVISWGLTSRLSK